MTTETNTEKTPIREVIVPKDLMRIMGCSRSQAYRQHTKYRVALGLEDKPLSVDGFCQSTGIERVRVIPHLLVA